MYESKSVNVIRSWLTGLRLTASSDRGISKQPATSRMTASLGICLMSGLVKEVLTLLACCPRYFDFRVMSYDSDSG